MSLYNVTSDYYLNHKPSGMLHLAMNCDKDTADRACQKYVDKYTVNNTEPRPFPNNKGYYGLVNFRVVPV